MITKIGSEEILDAVRVSAVTAWQGVTEKREEILRAFVAAYGCLPHEVEIVEKRTEEHLIWYVRLKAVQPEEGSVRIADPKPSSNFVSIQVYERNDEGELEWKTWGKSARETVDLISRAIRAQDGDALRRVLDANTMLYDELKSMVNREATP